MLINELAIHSGNTELLSKIEQLKTMFPNATIFDENKNVLVYGINIEKINKQL